MIWSYSSSSRNIALTSTNRRAAVNWDGHNFQRTYPSVTHYEGEMDMSFIVSKMQIRALTIYIVTRIREVLKLHRLQLPKCWSSSELSILLTYTGSLSIFLIVLTAHPSRDHPNRPRLGKGLEEFAFPSTLPAQENQEGHTPSWRLKECHTWWRGWPWK